MQKILKATDIMSNEFDANGVDKDRKFFAVFGNPIGHSLSPLMQNAALEEIAKTDASYQNAEYFAVEVKPENLAETLKLFWQKNFVGINLTIPHKEIAMNIVRDFDTSAISARACNTLLRTEDGWRGFNTDGFGVSAAVEQGLNRKFENAEVVMLGAGGAARGAAAAIIAAKCKRLIVANRNQDRLQKFAQDITNDGFDIETKPLENIEESIPDGAIIVNATSIGLKESDAPIIDFSKISKNCVFLDMPYRRETETTSVVAARKNSIAAENGLAMLAWQGAKSLSIWTGKPLYGNLMLDTLKKGLYGRK